MDEKCTCHKIKQRSEEERRLLINRLNRIEGQIRGLRRMVEEDAYCPDILVQASAANSAIHSFERELLASHMKSCVVSDIRDGKDEVIDELLNIIEKISR